MIIKILTCILLAISTIIAGQSAQNANDLYQYMNYEEIFDQRSILSTQFIDIQNEEGTYKRAVNVEDSDSETEEETAYQSANSGIRGSSVEIESNQQYSISNILCCRERINNFTLLSILSCNKSSGYRAIIDQDDGTPSKPLGDALEKLFREKKKTAMRNTICAPCVACTIPVLIFGSIGYFITNPFTQGLASLSAAGNAIFGTQSLVFACYRTCAPQMDPIDSFEVTYAKRKRFFPLSLQKSIEIKFGAFRKSTMGETAILDFCKIALNLPIRSKKPTSDYDKIAMYLGNYGENTKNFITHTIVHHDANYFAKSGYNRRLKSVLYLHGIPGVGKTKMVKKIAKYMQLPLIHIDCGSADQARIFGTGADPGLLLRAVTNVKSPNKEPIRNAILFLDELDRVVNRPEHKNFLTSLLPFFEPSTKFIYNPYINADIDISHYFIVGAGNFIPEDPALQDRMDIVEIKGMDISRKKIILEKTKDELLNSELDEYRLTTEVNSVNNMALTESEKEELRVIIDTKEEKDSGFRTQIKKLADNIDKIRLNKLPKRLKGEKV